MFPVMEQKVVSTLSLEDKSYYKIVIFHILVYDIKKLVKLEELTINTRKLLWHCCINIPEICTPLRNLRTLHLYNVDLRLEGNMSSTTWPSLEELYIRDCKISGEFPQCPRIQVFLISRCRSHWDEVIHKFLTRHATTLVRLELNCNRQPITDDQFLNLIKCAKNLTHFNCGIDHSKLGRESYLRSFLTILRDNGFSADKPFELASYNRNFINNMSLLVSRCPWSASLNLFWIFFSFHESPIPSYYP